MKDIQALISALVWALIIISLFCISMWVYEEFFQGYELPQFNF